MPLCANPSCGREFTVAKKDRQQRFHAPACWYAYRRTVLAQQPKKMVILRCQNPDCGKAFQRRAWVKQSYCSRECGFTSPKLKVATWNGAWIAKRNEARRKIAAGFHAKFGPLSARELEIIRYGRSQWRKVDYANGYNRAAYLRGIA